ncbi:hypothetical protein PHLCEN_2v4736 [Hermanssonia centrifuga]|uniref:Uncharacterized protein n=1 Tax=Hermanssonia centrifuga TaxID=98765 RepID=A0A2R6PJ95_9APHY|nr:hypothetical protein PHLCEN_2v4736 [Hermanssonia centrifuga]
MVDVTFKARTEHFIPLSLLKQIASNQPDSEPPSDVAYIGKDGVSAIKEMALVSRGRLSVQRVEEATWAVIEKLAKGGGWDESGKAGKVGKPKPPKPAAKQAKDGEEDVETSPGVNLKGSTAKKRKATAEDNEESKPLRRSTRARK